MLAVPTLMRPSTVSATAVPARSGPKIVKTAATATAVTGRMARVATGAATEFDESWNPLVTSNATARATTTTSATTPPPLTRAVSLLRARLGAWRSRTMVTTHSAPAPVPTADVEVEPGRFSADQPGVHVARPSEWPVPVEHRAQIRGVEPLMARNRMVSTAE